MPPQACRTAILHDTRVHERRQLAAPVELTRGNIRVARNLNVGNCGRIRLLNGKRPRHEPARDLASEVPFLARKSSKNIGALAALRKTVLRTVYHTPLNGVAQVIEAGEDDCEVTPTLRRRALEQAINVLEQHVSRSLELKEPVDVPPEHALLALDTARLGKRLGDGVVLAGKASHHHVDVGNLNLPALELVENNVNILVYHGVFAKACAIATRRELLGLGSGRLPLIRPDSFVGARRRQLHLRLVGVVVSLEAQPKPADTRKELGHSDGLLRRHVSPFAVCVAIARSS